MADAAASYALGHSEQELARLERQGQLFSTETRDVLYRAGIRSGMNVLDVGSGIGDVSLVAAEMVGPKGSVLGIDNAADALPMARARAARLKYDWVKFSQADLHSFQPEQKFDALVGRFILMHLPDPIRALRLLLRHLNPGASVAFIEMDIDEAGAVPEIRLLRQCIDWITNTYRRTGVDPNMGSHLYRTFRASGLLPDLTGMTRIASADDVVVFAFAAQTLASLMPRMEALGIATKADVGLETLAERLHTAAVKGDHCIMMPRLVGAWAKTPA